MKRFQFPLQAAMTWRERTAEQERSSLQHMFKVLSDLEAERTSVSGQLRLTASPQAEITAADLHRMAAHRDALVARDVRLAQSQQKCEDRIVQQRQKCVEADRDHRLLAKLRESHWATWQAQADREIERSAAESYLANWIRKKS